jgi:hypothetical protein
MANCKVGHWYTTKALQHGEIWHTALHLTYFVLYKKINDSLFHLAFGFCEYVDPETGLRAIRLLHDLPFGDKNLVVSHSQIIL